MSIAERVSRLLLHTRIVEESLHGDPDTWAISNGPYLVPAQVRVEADQVMFAAVIPASSNDDEASLWHDGELRSVRKVGVPAGGGAFLITWAMNVTDVVSA